MVSRFSILCNAAAAHFSVSSGQTAVQEVNGRDGVFLVFSRLRLFGLSARKALRGSHARGARRAGRAFCSRPSAPCTVLQCAPCSRWARIASARSGSSRCSAASPQRRRNTPSIFSATPCSACASGTTARQKRTSTAVSVCRSRSRGGVLGALAVRLVQPALAALAAGIPSAVTNTVLLCLGIDALWSTGVLLRWGDIDLLAPSRLRRKYRTA